MWDGSEQTPSSAWLEMAKIFIDAGCDPNMADHDGYFPHQVAKQQGNYELAKFLEQVLPILISKYPLITYLVCAKYSVSFVSSSFILLSGYYLKLPMGGEEIN